MQAALAESNLPLLNNAMHMGELEEGEYTAEDLSMTARSQASSNEGQLHDMSLSSMPDEPNHHDFRDEPEDLSRYSSPPQHLTNR